MGVLAEVCSERVEETVSPAMLHGPCKEVSLASLAFTIFCCSLWHFYPRITVLLSGEWAITANDLGRRLFTSSLFRQRRTRSLEPFQRGFHTRCSVPHCDSPWIMITFTLENLCVVAKDSIKPTQDGWEGNRPMPRSCLGPSNTATSTVHEKGWFASVVISLGISTVRRCTWRSSGTGSRKSRPDINAQGLVLLSWVPRISCRGAADAKHIDSEMFSVR